MNIALFGANGQVGQAFLALAPRDWNVHAFTRAEVDLANPEGLAAALSSLRPDWIVNASAYTQVDRAESDREICEAVNAKSVQVLAQFATEQKIPLVHFSTDYVYSGVGTQAFSESDPTSPQNFYGVTKLQGDLAVQAAGGDYLIFRTSWVYSHTGKNFVLTMLKFGKEREELKIVSDQMGSPTYAPDLAQMTIQAMEKAKGMSSFPSGVYHATNSGYVTWFEFAKKIFSEARELNVPLKVQSLLPLLTAEYPTPAKRPLNSRLSLQKLKAVFGIEPRSWESALHECLSQVDSSVLSAPKI